jgi:biopolymer transport protein TolR
MRISGRSFTLADRRRAARRRRSGYICRIDMSPLAGIFVALWLVVAPVGVIDFGFVAVDLPERLHAGFLTEAGREDALRVSVSRDGRYFVGYREISLGELADRVREAVWRGAERKVYLAADARAKYGTVKLALAEVQRGGIREIAILTN